MNLQKLSEKVQAMLDGEKKRREVALNFVEKLQEILEPVASDVWGEGYDNISAVYIWRIKKDTEKKEYTDIYFRYSTYRGNSDNEHIGFYDGEMAGFPLWGKGIEDLRGRDFWYVIQVLIEWVPLVAELIDKKQSSRDELLNLLA
jgi:hypothetical protein